MAGKYFDPELFEGNGSSKLAHVIQQLGHNTWVDLQFATVIEDLPNLKIKIDSDGLVLEKDDFFVLESLTRHKRIVSIDFEFPKTWKKKEYTGNETVETVSSRNDIGSTPSTPYEKYEMKYAELTFEDELKVGDRVIVACIDEQMEFLVIDRVKKYR